MKTSSRLCLTAVVLIYAATAPAQIPMSGGGYAQNFNSLATGGTQPWVNNGTLPGWYAQSVPGGVPTPIGQYTGGTGTGTAGALYSFGTIGVNPLNERALGSIASGGTSNLAYGVRFTNNTSMLMGNINVVYTGEQWRNGSNASPNSIQFSYRVSPPPNANPDAANLLAWTGVASLNFTTPVFGIGLPPSALDGNASTNRAVRSGVLSGVVVPPGAEIFLRWLDQNDPGNDPGLAVDDLMVGWNPVPPPATGSEYFFPVPILPPTNTIYRPPWYSQISFGAVVISNAQHSTFTFGTNPPPLGQTQVESFGSTVEFYLSLDGGSTFTLATGSANTSVRVTHTMDVSGTEYYQTELLSLDLIGSGFLLRESPTVQSSGSTTIRPVLGGYMISSLFDVATELSLDGGTSWTPASGPPHHVELRKDPRKSPAVPEPTPHLPPPKDHYVSPQQWHALFAQGIVIKDVSHRLFTQSFLPPPTGGSNTHALNSQLDLQVSTDGGLTFEAVRAPAPVGLAVANIGSSGEDGVSVELLETEMLSLTVTLPGGQMLRESPTEPSRGATQLRPQADGTYRINSFFDIFPELSVDGGTTWTAASNGPVKMELVLQAPEVPAPNPFLPVTNAYVSPADWHAYYANGIIITNASHDRFTSQQPPPPPGGSQTHNFGSTVSGLVSQDGGATFQPLSGFASVDVHLQSRSDLDMGNTRFFDTEILSLNLSAGPIMLRESPTRASLGRTSERNPAAGNYQVASFFDVYTEISLDGGQTWSPQTNPPATMTPQGGNNPTPPIEIDHFPATTAQITLQLPGGGTEEVALSGPTTVHVMIAPDGTGAADTDFDGLDQVTTEMVDMSLTGVSSLGPVLVNLASGPPTLGEIEETANTVPGRLDLPPFAPNGTATSFFDVYVELHFGGQTLHPELPLRLESLIRHKPPAPGDTYVNPFVTPIQLLDSNGVPTGLYILQEVHTPNPTNPPPVEIDHFPATTAQITLQLPGGGTEVVSLVGPSTVHVLIPPSGAAADYDGDGRDQVQTEMMDMSLTGNSSLGPVTVNLDPDQPSYGEIEEQMNNTPAILDVPPFAPSGLADSFFDVFVKIQVNGQTLRPATPLYMQAVIRNKPPRPGDQYVNPFAQPVPLLDANGNPTGLYILQEVHTPNPTNPPPVEIDHFPATTAQITLQLPGGGSEQVNLVGPSTVHVLIAPDGTGALDTDADGLDQVQTEMVDMSLTGNSSLGPVQVHLNPAQPSYGEIEETANSQMGRLDLPPFAPGGTAVSFFDVFVEIEVGGQTLRPAAPLHMQSLIRNKPPRPGDTYVNPFTQPVPLLDANGNPTGLYILQEVHTPNPTNPPPVEIDHFPATTAQITLQLPGGGTEQVNLAGPSTVHVLVAPDGTGALDTDADGLEQVQTEMVDMSLTGNSSMGPVQVHLDPTQPSYGEIEETANSQMGRLDLPPFAPGGTAVSFFDVFVEIEVGGQTLRPATPLHMQSLIRNKPPRPGDTYVNPFTQPVPLLDANGNPTGFYILQEVHTPNPTNPPPVEIDHFPATTAQITLQLPGGGTEQVNLAGPSTVHVLVAPDGTGALDLDADGLDQVQTEMVDMSLTGNSSMGPVQVHLDPTQPSYGQIEETANAVQGRLDLPPFAPGGTAVSFFDVFVEIEVGGQTLRPATPLHMQSLIRNKPPAPGDEYVNPFTQPVPLLDANGNPTGLYILQEVHTPNPTNPPPVEIDFFPNTTAQITLQLPGGGTEAVSLAGPTEVHVLIAPDGAAADYDADGRDQVQTEMVMMSLSGNSSLGPVTVQLDPTQPTYGEIEEQVNNTPAILDVPPFTAAGLADSFFDVFVKIQVGSQTLHPATPLRMESVIRHKPPAPGDEYVNPFGQPIELLDANGNPTGIYVVQEVHTPNPTNPPVLINLICSSNITVTATSAAGATVFYSSSVSGGCPPVMVNCSPLSGSTFPIGTTTVFCTANDACGTTTNCSFTVTVERPPIDLVCSSNIVVTATSSNGATVFYSSSVSGGCPPVMVNCSPLSGSTFPIGTTTVFCTASDACGTTTNCSFTVTVNPPPPIDLVCSSNIVVTAESCSNASAVVFYSSSASGGCAPVNVAYNPSSGSTFPVGTTTVFCTATDGCGQSTNCSFTVTVTPYVCPPIVLSCSSNIVTTTASCSNSSATVFYTSSASGGCAPVNVTCNPLSGSSFPLGTTTVFCTATDACGSTTNCSFTVTVNPFVCPPISLNCASNVVVTTTNPAGAVVFYTSSASGGCPLVTVVCNPPSGSTFPIGTTVVTCTATDACSNNAFCSFTVTVRPLEVDSFANTTAEITLQHPGGATEVVLLQGPTVVHVTVAADGTGVSDDDFDGLDQAETEMVLLDLSGNSSLGPVTVNLTPGLPTTGEIEERANMQAGRLDLPPFSASGLADSFFDVFVDLNVSGQTLRPAMPLRMHSVITYKPPGPGDTYTNVFLTPVDLLDSNGVPTGIKIVREVHTPNPGTNPPIEIDHFPNTTAQITLQLAGGGTEQVELSGPTTVHVTIAPDGTGAADTDFDGLDQVTTEMVDMSLAGMSSLGPVLVNLAPGQPTLGQIEETANSVPGRLDLPPFAPGGTANSYFDVFVELHVNGQTLHPAAPLHLESVIRHKPPRPGDTYVNPFMTPIQLLDSNGVPTGLYILQEVHTPNPTNPPPVEIDHFPATTASITLQLPGGGSEQVNLTGPSTVHVLIAPNGTGALDLDADGLDQVQTEMVDMSLTGNSSMGPVQVHLDPTQPSYGEIEETANAVAGRLDVPPFAPGGTAVSFFDVFVEIEVGGQTLRPATPLHMQSLIRNKPPRPGDTYVNPFTQPVPLLDANGNPTGLYILQEVHTPNPTNPPPVEIDHFPATTASITLQLPGVGTEQVNLVGPSTVHVLIAPNGTGAMDLDADGLDQVQTEMVDMSLTGNSSMGPVLVHLDPTQPSYGQIEETANSVAGRLDVPPFAPGGTAVSFFDVFVEIEVGGQTLRPATPLHMQSLIRNKPPRPGDTYVNPFTQPVPLLDANGNPTGLYILQEVHTPNPTNPPPVEIDHFPATTASITLQLPGVGTEQVNLVGPSTVHVLIAPNGTGAMDLDADGLDQVQTEMVDMSLTGNSSMGPVLVHLDPTQPSYGQIEETANSVAGRLDVPPFAPGGTAVSFFDVFVEIEVGGQTLRPATPLHMQSLIRNKPPRPGDTYVNPFTQPVPLLDANGNPTGLYILQEVHTPNPTNPPPVEIDHFPATTASITLQLPGGGTEQVNLAGPSTVHVLIAPNGTGAMDLDADGLDQVQTEMVDMSLTGNSSMGPVLVHLDPTQPSYGQIEETANSVAGRLDVPPFAPGGTAVSFFDVFVEIEVGGQTLRPATPLHMQSLIRNKPPRPGDTYVNPFTQPVPLLDANGNPTGLYILQEVHTPNPTNPPPVEIDHFPATTASITLQLPGVGTEQVNLVGPSTVHVLIAPNGTGAMDLDADGLDQVQTEMVDMSLTGNSSMGPVLVHLDPTQPSYGQIEETANSVAGRLDVPPFAPGGTAVSFFDVFVEIEVGGQTLRPATPLHMQSLIRNKPPRPGDTYVNPFTQPVPLLDANGNPTGLYILQEVHTPNPTNPPPVEIDHFPATTASITLQLPGVGTEQVNLVGPSTVHVLIAPNGTGAMDLDADGLDQVQTEMVDMSLTGNSSMGPVLVHLDPTQPSYGQIEETANSVAGRLDVPPFAPGGTAVSFFDVFVEIEVGGQTLRPATPLHMQSLIRNKPPRPGDTYVNPFTQPVPLLDANGNPTGLYILQEVHTPNPTNPPPVEIDHFPATTASITLQLPGGGTEQVNLAGPSTVHVLIAPNGTGAMDLDADGLDQVQTEMVDMSLTGNSSMGPVLVHLDPTQPSYGQIEETANSVAGRLDVPPFAPGGTAVSFFDVFVEIEVGGQTLRPATPLHMQSVIRNKPPAPGDEYVNPFTQPVPLLDANGNPTGLYILQEVHTPNPTNPPPVEIDFFPNTTAQITLQLPGGGTEAVSLAGPTEVHVLIAPNGAAADYDADGRDQVQTEMVMMSLSGNSSLGPVTVQLDPTQPTYGEIEEQVNNTPAILDVPPFTAAGLADSFFDVFVKIQVGSQTLHPATPLHMRSVIRHKPPAPGDEYVNPFGQPIELLDANGNPTGIYVVQEVHTPNPTNPPLSLTCSSNIVVAATGANGAVVTFSSSASGGCPLVTVNCVPPSGSVFPIGTTTVTCTASDGCGSNAVCTFTVTVNRPTITIQPAGNQVQVIWSGGTLQEADNVHGPYIDVDPQPTSPWTINPAGGKKFFRVRAGQPGFTFYDTEMLEMIITGGSLPAGMIIRESPSLASTGKTAISPAPGGGYVIDSFFDVFTELSTDGGTMWMASTGAPPRMRFTGPAGSNTLPPTNSVYVSPQQWHALYAQGIYITNANHLGFLGSFPPPPPGGISDVHSFGSTVNMLVRPCPICPYQPVSAPANVTVRVSSRP